ncbi:MAG: hypothetical protein A2X49_09370 [Lentisphaerae bacterium GWF2_52_8]|nr:MAG: hypothetical protein A2X49_09370 [Lentisphaerae bacterium GWF2_52_8]
MKKITGGENVSPALSWNNAPAGTKSFALTCVDVHPVARNWVHWMVTGIPASGSSLGEGASGAEMPKASVELKNSFGFAGWGGPQPPPGSGKHKYVFTIYALSVETVQLGQAPVPEEKFIDALNGKVLAKAAISGTFERK